MQNVFLQNMAYTRLQLTESSDLARTCSRLTEKCVQVLSSRHFLPFCPQPLKFQIQLEQDNQTLASLAELLTRMVDAAVAPPLLPLPDSPSNARSSGNRDNASSARSGQLPALSLEALQWEQLRVDQTLVVYIATSASKIAQLEAAADAAAALHRDALSRVSELKEECSRLRTHGEILKPQLCCFANGRAASDVESESARLRQCVSADDAAHKQAVAAIHAQNASVIKALQSQLKEASFPHSLRGKMVNA